VVFLPFFASLKLLIVCNLISVTEYQHCQLQMTQLSILSIFALSLALSLSLSISFCLRPVSEADAEGLGTTISPPTHPPTPFVDFFLMASRVT
jgi:hypothetical protein